MRLLLSSLVNFLLPSHVTEFVEHVSRHVTEAEVRGPGAVLRLPLQLLYLHLLLVVLQLLLSVQLELFALGVELRRGDRPGYLWTEEGVQRSQFICVSLLSFQELLLSLLSC